MTYLIIADDPQATLEIIRESPTYDGVMAALRNMGSNRVYPDRELGVAGWLSDVGNVMPEFHRNVVGSCLMLAMGAHPNPLGGPLVITGYEFPKPGEEEMGFPEPMHDGQINVVVGLYVAVLTALGMVVPGSLERYRRRELTSQMWADQVRRDMQVFRDAAAGGLTIHGHPGQFTPQAAASEVVSMMFPGTSLIITNPQLPPPGQILGTILTVRTMNPDLLDETLASLPGCDAAVVHRSHDPDAGTCKVRVLSGLGFLKFAMENQGYGEVVAEEPEGS